MALGALARKSAPGASPGTNGKPAPVLSHEASVVVRGQLMAEREGLALNEDLDAWTLPAWPKANSLTLADGVKVRLAFEARLARLQTPPDQDLRQPKRTSSGGRRPRSSIGNHGGLPDGDSTPPEAE